MRKWVIAVIGVLLLVAAITTASHFTLSALPEPGRTEAFLATKAKHYLVRRSSRVGIPRAPADRQSAIKVGDRLFGTECASCHGPSGHSPTDAGGWMYPRAADLTSHDARSYSDQELFWIIKNGIRLSGMPAFGRAESDEHIWDLVLYVRMLPEINSQPLSQNRV